MIYANNKKKYKLIVASAMCLLYTELFWYLWIISEHHLNWKLFHQTKILYFYTFSLSFLQRRYMILCNSFMIYDGVYNFRKRMREFFQIWSDKLLYVIIKNHWSPMLAIYHVWGSRFDWFRFSIKIWLKKNVERSVTL